MLYNKAFCLQDHISFELESFLFVFNTVTRYLGTQIVNWAFYQPEMVLLWLVLSTSQLPTV